MVVFMVWFINFQSERELCGLFSTRVKAQKYIDGFSDEKMEIEEAEVE